MASIDFFFPLDSMDLKILKYKRMKLIEGNPLKEKIWIACEEE